MVAWMSVRVSEDTHTRKLTQTPEEGATNTEEVRGDAYDMKSEKYRVGERWGKSQQEEQKDLSEKFHNEIFGFYIWIFIF